MIDSSSYARRVLVIDDQDAIHEAFRIILQRSAANTSELDDLETAVFGSSDATEQASVSDIHFDVEYAHQGEQGYAKLKVALAQGRPFGVAFVDMRMPPGWDGLETIRNLWQLDPGLQVVVCTAYSDHVWKDVCRQLGRTDQLLLLNKPFANEYVISLACSLTEKRCLLERLRKELALAHESNNRLQHEIRCRESAEKSLREVATRDVLTGLPNRAVLIERLRECVARHHHGSNAMDALLFLDIDNFKLINDSLGHNAGDLLLKQFAGRLESLLRGQGESTGLADCALYRLGGDEFVILARNLPAPDAAVGIAIEIKSAMLKAFDIPGCDATIGTSIGIANIDKYAVDSDHILRNADTAMYRAKQSGKNRYAIFDDEMHQAVLSRLRLENDLRSAVERCEFSVHYQPIVHLASRRTMGFEALARWQTADGEFISPSEFIPIAEDTGLIVPLGRWIMERACVDFATWRQSVPDAADCTISVNVSKRQLTETTFVEDVQNCIRRAGLTNKDLNIEVTETSIIGSPQAIVERLESLHDLGLSIHMDDFGTGLSSLSCLHKFPIDVLKIDQSFIAMMESDVDYGATVEAIIALARSRKMVAIAEGIETQRQLDRLVSLGCELGQGYFLERPSPAEQSLSRRSIAPLQEVDSHGREKSAHSILANNAMAPKP